MKSTEVLDAFTRLEALMSQITGSDSAVTTIEMGRGVFLTLKLDPQLTKHFTVEESGALRFGRIRIVPDGTT